MKASKAGDQKRPGTAAQGPQRGKTAPNLMKQASEQTKTSGNSKAAETQRARADTNAASDAQPVRSRIFIDNFVENPSIS